MMSIFNEETLEKAVIELFETEGYPHVHGESIHTHNPHGRKRPRYSYEVR